MILELALMAVLHSDRPNPLPSEPWAVCVIRSEGVVQGWELDDPCQQGSTELVLPCSSELKTDVCWIDDQGVFNLRLSSPKS